jgi:hypothetical protein
MRTARDIERDAGDRAHLGRASRGVNFDQIANGDDVFD